MSYCIVGIVAVDRTHFGTWIIFITRNFDLHIRYYFVPFFVCFMVCCVCRCVAPLAIVYSTSYA